MKKLVLTVAILVSGVATTFASPLTPNQNSTLEIVANNEFTEIAVDKLPAAVTEAVKKDFPNATISKAYVNENEIYQLDLSVNGAEKTVYADKEGNWVESK
ncbi:hypothetical protein [Ochrovirga pacifica]|uniref:hypothetical protein n=1 Tax=Ochrovirga pacifica TaxID=1042376 RepID=UPI0002559DCD|nr:hypothetical protein [Ochrovirga pacifica]